MLCVEKRIPPLNATIKAKRSILPLVEFHDTHTHASRHQPCRRSSVEPSRTYTDQTRPPTHRIQLTRKAKRLSHHLTNEATGNQTPRAEDQSNLQLLLQPLGGNLDRNFDLLRVRPLSLPGRLLATRLAADDGAHGARPRLGSDALGRHVLRTQVSNPRPKFMRECFLPCLRRRRGRPHPRPHSRRTDTPSSPCPWS